MSALRERGVEPQALEGETDDAVENRLATALMALYRDTRSQPVFEALYVLTRAPVLAWIKSLLRRNRAHLDPTELLQDTFVNVYRYPKAFRDDHNGSFRVWVRTIAGNIVRRAGSSRRRLSFQELPEGLQEPEDLRECPAAHAEIGEERVLLRSAWVLFLWHYGKAWQELAPRDKRALHLVEVEGLSYQEAGEILQVGRSNMKMIVFRARLRISRRIRDAMGGALRHLRDVRTEHNLLAGAA
ncbi:MAG: sigma-70 family RNA polymerase sigma factor [Planctomycetota bacterium]